MSDENAVHPEHRTSVDKESSIRPESGLGLLLLQSFPMRLTYTLDRRHRLVRRRVSYGRTGRMAIDKWQRDKSVTKRSCVV